MLLYGCDTNTLTCIFFVNIQKVTQAELQKFLNVCSPSPEKDSLYHNLNICIQISIQIRYFKENKRPVASLLCSGKGTSNAILSHWVEFILTFGKPIKKTRDKNPVSNTMSTEKPRTIWVLASGPSRPQTFVFPCSHLGWNLKDRIFLCF